MKKILIISPHFPPSNLTAVHRSRFFAQHLPKYGWQPIILTVHEKFYEEKLDHNLEKLLPANLRIEKATAMAVGKPRLIGDIGLRAFYSMFKKAKAIIRNEKIDFLYIIIPSFYGALWGRWLHHATGVPYGIDYIDPWVHVFAGSNKKLSRAWWATKVSAWLEPIAVKHASLITGVAASYYEGVQKRNPGLTRKAKFFAIPFGSEEDDYEKLRQLNLAPYLFKVGSPAFKLVFAGAMQPMAYGTLEQIFSEIKNNIDYFTEVEFHFIGSGKNANDPNGYNIKPLAQKYGLWQTTVFEYPKRIPYLDVLVHLNAADAVFILGSIEAHYAPSKVYQAVLSAKPVLAILHRQSTAVKVLQDSGAGFVISFNNEDELKEKIKQLPQQFGNFKQFVQAFNPAQVNKSDFEQYSAYNITGMLACKLDEITV